MTLHQDNAPPHKAKTTQLEIDVLRFETVDHLPYSPDLATMDSRVFPVLKSALRCNRFDSFTELSYAAENVACTMENVVCTIHNGLIDTVYVSHVEENILRKNDAVLEINRNTTSLYVMYKYRTVPLRRDCKTGEILSILMQFN